MAGYGRGSADCSVRTEQPDGAGEASRDQTEQSFLHHAKDLHAYPQGNGNVLAFSSRVT